MINRCMARRGGLVAGVALGLVTASANAGVYFTFYTLNTPYTVTSPDVTQVLMSWSTNLTSGIVDWRAGPPGDPMSRLGPLVSRAHFEKVRGYLELATTEGGRVLGTGPHAAEAEGWFVPATLLSGLPATSRCASEEIFGPVLTLHAFEDEAEAIAMANATPYGLSATVLTSDVSRAHRVAAALEVGLVWINTWMSRDLRVPFGGSKQSGVGREGGWEAMRFFTEPKNVCLAI